MVVPVVSISVLLATARALKKYLLNVVIYTSRRNFITLDFDPPPFQIQIFLTVFVAIFFKLYDQVFAVKGSFFCTSPGMKEYNLGTWS